MSIEQVTERIADYFSTKSEISAVYLFGSYAQGQPRPTSDIDLGLLFESRDRRSILKKLDQHHLALARLLRKDLHLVALNYASELLLKQVFTKGRCITANHPKQLAAFKMTALAKIADIGFYKPNMEKGFTRKLVHG